MNQQQLIIEAIENAMDPHPITIDGEYANTGVIRAFDIKTMFATRSIHFDFQLNRCEFKRPGPPGCTARQVLAAHVYGRARLDHEGDHVKSTPAEVVDAVVAYLKGRDE